MWCTCGGPYLTGYHVLCLQVLVNIGMVQNINMYCGVLFQFRKLPSSQLKRKHKKHILAAGGRYDRLVSMLLTTSIHWGVLSVVIVCCWL